MLQRICYVDFFYLNDTLPINLSVCLPDVPPGWVCGLFLVSPSLRGLQNKGIYQRMQIHVSLRPVKRANQYVKGSLQHGQGLVAISSRPWNDGFTASRIFKTLFNSLLNNRWEGGATRNLSRAHRVPMKTVWSATTRQHRTEQTVERKILMRRGRGEQGEKLYEHSPAAKNTWNELTSAAEL